MGAARVEWLIRELLVELGEDPTRPALALTPRRLGELLSTFDAHRAPPAIPAPTEKPDAPGQMVLLRDLRFVSLCEHHLLPFFGWCQIGCIPRERACVSWWCMDVVAFFAHRPQLQERITEQIADMLFAALEPEGVGVAIDGRHMCMMMRGVEKQNSHIQTSSLRGSFLQPIVRQSFTALMARRAGRRSPDR